MCSRQQFLVVGARELKSCDTKCRQPSEVGNNCRQTQPPAIVDSIDSNQCHQRSESGGKHFAFAGGQQRGRSRNDNGDAAVERDAKLLIPQFRWQTRLLLRQFVEPIRSNKVYTRLFRLVVTDSPVRHFPVTAPHRQRLPESMGFFELPD